MIVHFYKQASDKKIHGNEIISTKNLAVLPDFSRGKKLIIKGFNYVTTGDGHFNVDTVELYIKVARKL